VIGMKAFPAHNPAASFWLGVLLRTPKPRLGSPIKRDGKPVKIARKFGPKRHQSPTKIKPLHNFGNETPCRALMECAGKTASLALTSKRGIQMHSVIYLVGLVVVVMAVLSFVGLA
jgi:hypothetical protein